MLVAAIDPGLDLVAAAIFETGQLPAKPQMVDCGRAFVRYETLVTGVRRPLGERLAEIHAWPQWLKATFKVGRLVVEEPRIWGTYGRNRGQPMQKGMAVFWMALGALLAGAERSDLHAETIKALTTPKEQRQMLVQSIMRASGRPAFAVGPRGGTQADIIDATFLGMWALSRGALLLEA